MRVAEKTKPILAAGGRDWGLEIADWGFGRRVGGRKCEIRDTRYEIRAGRVDGAPNKANFGHGKTAIMLFDIAI
jgi:hypothetical protein